MAYTVQSFMQQALEPYLKSHRLPRYQLKGASRLRACRTAAMGGHALYCGNGHFNGYWYNSCGHRSCPQCGALKREQWQRKVEGFILDCPHHHWVFTLPHALHVLWCYNREQCQQLLFKSVRETIQQLSADSQYLGARSGCILALHTWARNLSFHPHIHCLVTHGGQRETEWVKPKKDILFPAKVMMKLFRGKYLSVLRGLLVDGELSYPSELSKAQVASLLNQWGREDWVVHCTRQYSHGHGVAKYLARYIRGGAIKNTQLRHVSATEVRYSYKSHQTQRTESMTMSHNDFMARIVSHVALPRKQQYHFVGLYHNRSRERLNKARSCLGQAAVGEVKAVSWREFMGAKGDAPCCEACGEQVTVLKRVKFIGGDVKFC